MTAPPPSRALFNELSQGTLNTVMGAATLTLSPDGSGTGRGTFSYASLPGGPLPFSCRSTVQVLFPAPLHCHANIELYALTCAFPSVQLSDPACLRSWGSAIAAGSTSPTPTASPSQDPSEAALAPGATLCTWTGSNIGGPTPALASACQQCLSGIPPLVLGGGSVKVGAIGDGTIDFVFTGSQQAAGCGEII